MKLDPATRFSLLFGMVTGLSWFLLAEEGIASPIDSIAAGVVAFIIVYAIASFIQRQLEDEEK